MSQGPEVRVGSMRYTTAAQEGCTAGTPRTNTLALGLANSPDPPPALAISTCYILNINLYALYSL